jgi:hypothetical protein
MIDRFVVEYWIFVEALLQHASDLLGVAALNELANGFGYPFGAALVLSAAGFGVALVFLQCGRPGWGLAGLALGEELSALSLASAALSQGLSFSGSIAVVRVAAALLAVALVSALLRKALRPAREIAAAGS